MWFQTQRVDNEEEYLVKKIHDKRVSNGDVEYLVEWVPSHGRKYWKKTWEPKEHLKNAKDKLAEFNSNYEKAGPSKKKQKVNH